MRPKIFSVKICNDEHILQISDLYLLFRLSANKPRKSKNVHGSHLVFQNEAKNIPRQGFMVMNISCKCEKCTYNTLASRGVTKNLHTVAAAAAAYLCVIHSIHWMLYDGYNKNSLILIFLGISCIKSLSTHTFCLVVFVLCNT